MEWMYLNLLYVDFGDKKFEKKKVLKLFYVFKIKYVLGLIRNKRLNQFYVLFMSNLYQQIASKIVSDLHFK